MSIALITGASSGLGREFAKLFANDGHSLVLVARRGELLEALASEISAAHPKIKTNVIAMDLGVPGAGQKLFEKTEALGLKIEFLVNNAGFGSNGAFHQLPLNKELQMLDLNMRTLLELTRLYLPGMLDRKSGKILNVGSTAGFQPGPYMTTYYASKAFVNSFSEGLHEELKGTGVSCTVLAPGATATEFSHGAGTDKSLLFNSGVLGSAHAVAIVGYNAMMAQRAMAISGLLNKIMVQLLRISPRFMARKLAGIMNRTK